MKQLKRSGTAGAPNDFFPVRELLEGANIA